jgi:ribosomal protein S18 acetylase RimI-like enzyme
VSSGTLETAATANFVTHATWASSRTTKARVEATPKLTVVDAGLDTDTFNIVCAANLSQDEVGPAAQRVVTRFAGVGRPFSWWVCPGDRPLDLAGRLEALGLLRAESELAMSVTLPLETAERSALVPGLSVERARTVEDLAVFARINAENWEPPDASVEEFYRRSATELVAGESPFRFHVARLRGRPVAAVEVTLAGGVAGVYGLSTRSGDRRRGIGSAILRSALEAAEAEGMATAVLQAAPEGVGLYRRLGFVDFGVITELKPPPVVSDKIYYVK